MHGRITRKKRTRMGWKKGLMNPLGSLGKGEEGREKKGGLDPMWDFKKVSWRGGREWYTPA